MSFSVCMYLSSLPKSILDVVSFSSSIYHLQRSSFIIRNSISSFFSFYNTKTNTVSQIDESSHEASLATYLPHLHVYGVMITYTLYCGIWKEIAVSSTGKIPVHSKSSFFLCIFVFSSSLMYKYMIGHIVITASVRKISYKWLVQAAFCNYY